MFRFHEDSNPRIREQILLYRMGETLTDRERADLLGLPEGCRIRERAKILAPENFKCGRYVWIGEGAVLDAQGGLEVGDYTQIGLNVMAWSHTSHRQAIMSQTCRSKKGITYKPTKIGSNCFIAGPSVIAPGVTIGNKVIVAPLTFIQRDVPDGTVISGDTREQRLGKRVALLEQVLQDLLRHLTGKTEGGSADLAGLMEKLST